MISSDQHPRGMLSACRTNRNILRCWKPRRRSDAAVRAFQQFGEWVPQLGEIPRRACLLIIPAVMKQSIMYAASLHKTFTPPPFSLLSVYEMRFSDFQFSNLYLNPARSDTVVPIFDRQTVLSASASVSLIRCACGKETTSSIRHSL